MLEAHTNCRLLPSSYFQPSSAAITVISVRFLSQTLVDASLFHYFAPNSVLLLPGKEGRKFPRRRNLPLKYEAEVPILWPPDVNSWLIGKDPDAGKDWRHKEKRVTEDEMVGWHHQFNGRELGHILGDGEGHGSLKCCSPCSCKESDTTKQQNSNSNHVCVHAWSVAQLCLIVCDPMDCPRNFPRKNTEVGCHFFLHGIFPI